MRAIILHSQRAFLFVLFILLLSVAGMTKALAQGFAVGDLNYSINGNGMSVTVTGHVDGSNAVGELVIPENVSYGGNTYVVTAIGDNAFYGHYGLEGSLVIPNSVTKIGYAAFSGCSGFNGTLTLGNSLTIIGSYAFEGCSGFTGNLVIPNSVSILGGQYASWGWDWRESYAFLGCSGFNGTLTLSNSLSAIGCGCFMGCSGFTGDLVIPISISQLGCSWGDCIDGVFEGCSGFTGDLTILGETEIGTNSFSGCSGFSGTLTLGAYIIGIYDNAFFGCEGFSSITALGTGGWLEGDAESIFAGVNMEIPVYVGCGQLDDFLFNPVWSSFSNIQETNPCLWEILATADPPEGGTVSGSGLYVYEEDQNGNYYMNVDLCATPKEGYIFYYWTDDFEWNEWDSLSLCNEGSITSDYTYHRHYVANFRHTSSEITAIANPIGGGSVSGGGIYDFGAECTLTATADEGYLFVDWTENGKHVSYDTSYSFIVTEGRNLVANFREGYGCAVVFDFYDEYGDGWNGNKLVVTDDLGYTYQLTLAEGFSGTQVLMLVSGSHITLTWIKNYWAFECSFTVSYLDGEVFCQVSEPNNSFFYEFDVDCGEMPLPSFDITAIANPVEGGTVSGGGEYDYRTECTLTATANENYTFVNWTKDGVEVSTDATYSFTVTEDAAFVANFTEGQVVVTQVSTFSQGYNWWGTYIEQTGINGLQMLEEGLGDNGITIRSQAGYTDYYAGYGWYGSLASIDNESSYKIKASAPCVAAMAGGTAVPSQHPITLDQGWTWMGYLPSFAMDINTALDGLEATQGDKVKSQEGYSDYYSGYGWFGSLNTIEPGMGLMYYSSNGEAVTFTYPDNTRGGELKVNLTSENNHWVPNTYAYPDNMTMMAVVELNDEELSTEDYELAAFAANGECRGSVKLTYAEPLHRHVAFLTISGKDAAELSFRLYNAETQEEYYDAEESLDFVANAMVGAADDLYTIHFRGMTGMDELAGKVKVYPNPVASGQRFHIRVFDSKNQEIYVEVVNALGVVVWAENTNGSSLEMTAPKTSGLYTVRVISKDKGIQYHKLKVE